jgi:hypothetical protein
MDSSLRLRLSTSASGLLDFENIDDASGNMKLTAPCDASFFARHRHTSR